MVYATAMCFEIETKTSNDASQTSSSSEAEEFVTTGLDGDWTTQWTGCRRK